MTVLDLVLHISQDKQNNKKFPTAASRREVVELAKKININESQAIIDLEMLVMNGVLEKYLNINKQEFYQFKKK